MLKPQVILIVIIRPELTRVKHLSGAPLYGKLLASPANIRLDWKGLPRTNTLVNYYMPVMLKINALILWKLYLVEFTTK
jgi:hypothetical protein